MLNDTSEELLQQDWTGKCYQAAMNWITACDEMDWVVVHGTVLNDKVGHRIDHAWCERNGIVVDLARPIGARVVEREQYYRVLKPEVSKKYLSNDALMLSCKNGHQGPWDESENLHE